MSKPIRVLQVVTHMERGGLETMLMNYYRNIDREKVQFDFLTHRDTNAAYNEEIKALGGKIYHLPRLNPFSRSYLNELDKFFKEHKEYKIVHCHQDCLSGVVLKVAKKNGVKYTIAHSHNANQDRNLKYIIKLMAKKNIPKYSDELFACGQEAGKWMFNTDNFRILNNAINTDDYVYDKDKAIRMKQKLEIENKFVIGHVGRFNSQKNHEFLIDIFNETQKKEKNSVLLLVGDGDLRGKIEAKVRELAIEDKVVFAGIRSDVNELMQAMDVFLFPSLYEGLPVTMVEAQSAGLKCFISDGVPVECIMTDNVEVISLKESAEYWADKIVSYKGYERKNTKSEIENANFDIKVNAKWLQEFYLNK